MRGLLAEINEKASGTHADVRRIQEKLIESLLAKSVTDAQGKSGEIDYRRIAAEVSSLLERQTPSEAQPASLEQPNVKWPPRKPTPNDERIRMQLKTFPAQEEASDALEVLNSLNEKSRLRLRLFGLDELRNRSPDSPFNPALSDAFSTELVEQGLIEPIDGYSHPIDNSPLMQLTERGREVARLLTADGAIPDYLEDLAKIRKALPNDG